MKKKTTLPNKTVDKPLAIVTESGEMIATATYDETHTHGLRHRSVFALVTNSKGELFVQKRSEKMRTLPGYYEVSAAGQVDAGDTPLQAAITELEEELGIKAKTEQLISLGEFKYYNRFSDTWIDNEIASFYLLSYDGPMVIDKNEIESGAFYSFEEFQLIIKKGEKCSPLLLEILKRYKERV